MNQPSSKADFDKPLMHIIDEACERYRDQVCLQFGAQKLSYGQLQQESIRVAQVLAANGFTKGMHGAVYSLNSAAAFVVTLGIIRAGGAWIPVNPRNSVEDNREILQRLDCDLLFYQGAFAEVTNDSDPWKSVCMDGESNNGASSLEHWLQASPGQPLDVTYAAEDIVSLPQTGGTTGAPKGVMISDRNFAALSRAMSDDLLRNVEGQPVVLCAAPMTHVGGRLIVSALAAGCRFVILDKVDPQEVLQTIEREEISHLFLPPTAIYSLLAQENVRDFDFSSLQAFFYGSAPMSISQLKLAIEVFGPVMSGGFGQTECPMMISALSRENHFVNGEVAPDERLRSVGKATSISELAILDDNYNPLPVGERGEIGVKGGMVSEGYYNAPEETEKIRKNGWHLTGDIGYLDEDGFLYIVGRKKDMIITGGFNVYASEVENTLSAIDGIDSVVVIGVPSELWGEEVKAFVIRNADSRISESEIIAQGKASMGSVKTPKTVEFVDEFPLTPLGKVDKKLIRAQYWR